MSWLVWFDKSGMKHVTPDFGREHDLTLKCWCRPQHDPFDASVIVHWSHEPVATFYRTDYLGTELVRKP